MKHAITCGYLCTRCAHKNAHIYIHTKLYIYIHMYYIHVLYYIICIMYTINHNNLTAALSPSTAYRPRCRFTLCHPSQIYLSLRLVVSISHPVSPHLLLFHFLRVPLHHVHRYWFRQSGISRRILVEEQKGVVG